jgi:superfamily I DNA and/or RNA helicase
MKINTKYLLQDFAQKLCQWSVQDVLVNIDSSSGLNLDKGFTSSIQVAINSDLKKLIQQTQKFEREFGISPLCYGEGKARLKGEAGFEAHFVPLFLHPLSYHFNQDKSQVTFKIIENEGFINPFVVQYLYTTFGYQVELDSSLNPIDHFQKLSQLGLLDSLQESFVLDLFHHHRYQIVRELEELQLESEYSFALEHFLGNEQGHQTTLNWVKQDLFPSNIQQNRVLDLLENENVILHGPPGTGKSQVLCNLVGKVLVQDKQCLIISEKNAALEVIVKKLHQKKLDAFVFVAGLTPNSSAFIKSIKKVWDEVEQFKGYEKPVQTFYPEYKNQLQFLLDRIHQPELIGGVSFQEYTALAFNINFEALKPQLTFPSLREFCTDRESLKQLYIEKVTPILQNIRFETFTENELNKFLSLVSIAYEKLVSIQQQFKVQTWSELKGLVNQLVRIQLVENCLNHSFNPLLQPDSKTIVKFEKLKVKREKLKLELANLEAHKEAFKELPSDAEIEGLIQQFTSKNWLQKIKHTKRLKQLFKSSFIDFKSSLTGLKKFNKTQSELNSIAIEFTKFGLVDIEQDLILIANYKSQLRSSDWQLHSEFIALGKLVELKFLADFKDLVSIFKTYFKLKETNSLIDVLQEIQTHQELLIRNKNLILNLNKSSYEFLNGMSSFEAYFGHLLKSNYVVFEQQFPELAKFSPTQLNKKLQNLKIEKEAESTDLIYKIKARISNQFEAYHTLMRETPTKISETDKELRKRLKRGKAILVKEFSKTKAHPTVRELLSSDAQLWIQLLKPICLCNPVELPKLFPVQKELFDLLLIDEASQMPMENCLGALHRSKRFLIAGDEQQMAPTNFFKKQLDLSVTAMHQAIYYVKGVALTNHYRSVNPELISFSNRYFYNNSLLAFPALILENTGVFLNYCPKGIYAEHKNEIEAERVVEILKRAMLCNKTIGVVAFSETQLSYIQSKIPSNLLNTIDSLIEDNKLFFKALENVQGDECDHLIISLGYAYSDLGEFHMRFGPLNQAHGSKRLNVLLSRAKERIDFVTSVKSSDFKISTNESVNLLRNFLIAIESQTTEDNSLTKLHGIQFDRVNSAAYIDFTDHEFKNVLTLSNTYDTLIERGWDVQFMK